MPEGFQDWSGRTFRNVDLSNTSWKETMLVNARFSGLITGLVVNDIEVAPLIDAEMSRRFPERAKLRPADAAGVREAWAVIADLWAASKARAAALSEEALDRRLEDDEWSWSENFRHLIMVTDGWISGTVLGRTGHFHPIGVPPSFLTDVPGIDVHASPTWAEVVAAREDRMAIVQHLVEDLADADLERPCGEHTLRACILTVLDEEWHHNWYANRDLDRQQQAQK